MLDFRYALTERRSFPRRFANRPFWPAGLSPQSIDHANGRFVRFAGVGAELFVH